MQVGDIVTVIDTGETGKIRNITHSMEGTTFYNRPLAIVRIDDEDENRYRARTEDELNVCRI